MLVLVQITMDAATTKTTEIPLLDSLLEHPCDDETLAALDDVSLENRIDQYVVKRLSVRVAFRAAN